MDLISMESWMKSGFQKSQETLIIFTHLLIIRMIQVPFNNSLNNLILNNSINVTLNPTLSAYITDPNGDILNITFSYYNGSKWIILQSYIDQPSGYYSAET